MTLLTLENVTLQFKGAEKPALRQINYRLQRGDFVIILGSNGSGKSTLLKLLHRHHKADRGEIQFEGKPLAQHHDKTFAQNVRVLTQNCAESLFASLTLYENYLLVKEQQHLKITSHAKEHHFLKQYLMDYNPNLANKLDCTMNQFSGGEKQAIALAFCLLNPPKLLLLDEHTSALDPKTSAQIMQLTHKMVKKYGITCLLTTHDLDIALDYGNRLLILRAGEIYKSIEKQQEMLSKAQLIEYYC